jgi:hypothetical protein
MGDGEHGVNRNEAGEHSGGGSREYRREDCYPFGSKPTQMTMFSPPR